MCRIIKPPQSLLLHSELLDTVPHRCVSFGGQCRKVLPQVAHSAFDRAVGEHQLDLGR
jgi:hypothetical protein